jgi:DNA-directed RNA polymerase subunit RPC12/RpoP
MASVPIEEQQLELALLRRGVGELQAARYRCVDCGRSPLIGEQVHVYDQPRRGIVCALCRPRRRRAPAASELVRHCERGHAVRMPARAA